MGDAAQRGLDAAEDDGHVGEELLENLRIDDGGVFWSHVVSTVGRVGILRTQAAVGGVFVHHRVHAARRNTEEEAGTTEFLEVAEVTVPVRLRDNRHPIACCLECSSDDSCTKRRMVDICVTRKENHVDLRPSAEFEFLLGRRQKVRQPIFHLSRSSVLN